MTSRDRLYRTEAVILRRHDLGEADKLLTIYTPAFGKMRVLAKGVRKPTSRKAGHVELFTHSRLLIAKGKSLDIVTQAETINAFLPIRVELQLTSYSYYLAELVDRFTEDGEENRRVFDLLVDALSWLGDARDRDLLLRYFELRLLDYVGYRPQLQHCVRCAQPLGASAALFNLEEGGAICLDCGRGQRGLLHLSAQAREVMLHLQSKEYAKSRGLQVEPSTRLELESVLRRYTTYLLERSLKSADFMDALRREEAGSSAPALEPRAVAGS